MLDYLHRRILERVSSGDADASPALDDLIATGLVQRAGDGYAVTAAGRAALAASKRAGLEKWGLRIAGAGIVVFALATVAGWITG